MKRLSLRSRIALLSASISGLVLLGLALGFWRLYSQQRIEALDTEIRALGTRHPGWLAKGADFSRLDSALNFIFGDEHRGKVILLVKDSSAHVLYTSSTWPNDLPATDINCSLENAPTIKGNMGSSSAFSKGESRDFSPGNGHGFGPGRGGGPVVFDKKARFFTVESATGVWRIGIMGNDELSIAVGLSYETVRLELKQVRQALILTIPLALILVAAGGWLVAGTALRPVQGITRAAAQVTAQGLDRRIPLSNEGPEIRQLIEVLNGMMDRLEKSFHQAIRFSADASHELKTPLAIMQGELENAIQGAVPGSDEQRVFSNLLEETHKLKAVTRSLLLLAQADSGRLKLTKERVALSEEVEAMAEDARILAVDRNLRFTLALEPNVAIEADRTLLGMAIFNLLRNAVTYNDANGFVTLSLSQGNRVELTICNGGPGIPQEDHARIFDRFYRVKSSANVAREGIGLGLSLAHEIIHAHGGSLTLQESRPGCTCFVARFHRFCS